MDIHLFSYYLGISIIFIMHTLLLVRPGIIEPKITSSVTLCAALCIAYYFMNKEKFIQF